MRVRELIEALEALDIDQEHEVFLVPIDDFEAPAFRKITEVGLYADGDVYIEG